MASFGEVRSDGVGTRDNLTGAGKLLELFLALVSAAALV